MAITDWGRVPQLSDYTSKTGTKIEFADGSSVAYGSSDAAYEYLRDLREFAKGPATPAGADKDAKANVAADRIKWYDAISKIVDEPALAKAKQGKVFAMDARPESQPIAIREAYKPRSPKVLINAMVTDAEKNYKKASVLPDPTTNKPLAGNIRSWVEYNDKQQAVATGSTADAKGVTTIANVGYLDTKPTTFVYPVEVQPGQWKYLNLGETENYAQKYLEDPNNRAQWYSVMEAAGYKNASELPIANAAYALSKFITKTGTGLAKQKDVPNANFIVQQDAVSKWLKSDPEFNAQSQQPQQPQISKVAIDSAKERLRAFYDNNGIPIDDNFIDRKAYGIAANTVSFEDTTDLLRKSLIKQYPNWADEIKAGHDLRDIASPYIALLEKTLEVPAAEIKLSDSRIQNALKYRDPEGNLTSQSWNDFTLQLRQDPKWAETTNGKEWLGRTSNTILQTMGII